jgi:hypothetical protein
MNEQASTKERKTQDQEAALLQDLLKDHPEVVLAQRVMEQTRKAKKPAQTVDQSNYYRLPSTQ